MAEDGETGAPPPDEIRLELRGHPTDVAHARWAVRRMLAEREVPGDAQEVAELLLAELVTNALRHGRGPIEVCSRIDLSAEVVHVAVQDRSPIPPAYRPASEVGAGGGFGLQLVARLASAWGTRILGGNGKAVWAEVPVTSCRAGAATASPCS